jgi:hypothetical protein
MPVASIVEAFGRGLSLLESTRKVLGMQPRRTAGDDGVVAGRKNKQEL